MARPWQTKDRARQKENTQLMETRYKAYISKISDLNQKKAFVSTYRHTLPPEDFKELREEVMRI
jgi:hypothetical protein